MSKSNKNIADQTVKSNSNSKLNAITRIFKLLCGFNNHSQEQLTNLVNNQVFIEYMFGRPIRSDNTENYHNFLPISLADSNRIQFYIIELMNYNEEYLKYYKLYSKLTTDRLYSKLTTDRLCLPYLISFPDEISSISEYLDDNDIDHCVNFNFKNITEHVNVTKPKPYSFDIDLMVDIFGCCSYNTNVSLVKELTFFAIILHTDRKLRTLIKSHYLSLMNVNVLYITNISDFEHKITQFMKQIKKGSYVSINVPKIPSKYLTDKYLKSFYQNYNTNHNTYYKYHRLSNNIDSRYIVNRTNNNDSPPNDENISITKNELLKIIENKYIFTV